MSVNSTIKTILDVYGYPVEFMGYEGLLKTYFVFNYSDDRGDAYSDDSPEFNMVSVQIHFFSPLTFNHLILKKQIRNALFENGFTYPTVQTFYESDTKLNHLIFECDYTEPKEV